MESVSESAATGRRATVTQIDEWMVHDQVFRIYDLFASIPRGAQTLMLELQRDKHVEYLTKGLQQLGPSFVVLDANRPWLCYWILHSLALLGQSVDHELGDNAVDFLNRCQDPNGGYGGGPGQLPHLATTYATVNSLITLGGEKALSSINRGKLSSFLQRMKQPSGAFRMHDAGEIDVRACYTAISVASVLNILDDELVMGVGNYILSCQTYEGGIAGEPGSEAHGGYTFCGLATMVLINEVNRLDLAGLINWVVFRQGVECGFQGRTNKLVDGCYSFWQGGVFALLQNLHVVSGGTLALSDGEGDSAKDSDSEGEVPGDNLCRDDQTCHCECGVTMTSYKIASYPLIPSVILLREIVFFVIILFLLICLDLSAVQSNAPGSVDCSGSYTQNLRRSETEPLFQSMALQQYILLCSQDQEGGFRDKPGKARDYYHTCYCLSGLSVCQYSWSKNENAPPLPNAVVGPYSNLLEPIHPVYNIVLQQYHEAHEFFSRS